MLATGCLVDLCMSFAVCLQIRWGPAACWNACPATTEACAICRVWERAPDSTISFAQDRLMSVTAVRLLESRPCKTEGFANQRFDNAALQVALGFSTARA
ncbi:unnamed protein product [Effrenium voratum]|nr:unnamed protein product [Effrenium voratum]